MKTIFVLMLGISVVLGCARVRVEAPKEPIKVDITMRLDIYQHVQKDIDAIEGIVSGSKEPSGSFDNRSLLDYFISLAYAQEDLSAAVEEAALRRKQRHSQLSSFQQKGVIGENRFGLVEIRDWAQRSESLEQLVRAENEDRLIIYRELAKKNNTSVEAIQELYAERLQKDAPGQTPIEVFNAASGNYVWKIK